MPEYKDGRCSVDSYCRVLVQLVWEAVRVYRERRRLLLLLDEKQTRL